MPARKTNKPNGFKKKQNKTNVEKKKGVVSTISCYTSIVFNRYQWLHMRCVIAIISVMIFLWSVEDSIFSEHYNFFEFVSFDLTWFLLFVNALYLACSYTLALVIHQSIQEIQYPNKRDNERQQAKKSNKEKDKDKDKDIIDNRHQKQIQSQSQSGTLDIIAISPKPTSATPPVALSATPEPETTTIETVDHIRYNIDNVPTLSELKLQYVHYCSEVLLYCCLSTNIIIAVLYWCLLFPHTTNSFYEKILNGFEYVVSPSLILFEHMCSSRRVDYKKIYLPFLYASILSVWIYSINRTASVDGKINNYYLFQTARDCNAWIITTLIGSVVLFISAGFIKNALITAYMMPIYVKDECIEDMVGIIPEDNEVEESHTLPGELRFVLFLLIKKKIINKNRTLLDAVRTLSKQQTKKAKKKIDTKKIDRTSSKNGPGDGVVEYTASVHPKHHPKASHGDDQQDREHSFSFDSESVSERLGFNEEEKSESDHSANNLGGAGVDLETTKVLRRTKSGYNYVIQEHMDSDDEALVAFFVTYNKLVLFYQFKNTKDYFIFSLITTWSTLLLNNYLGKIKNIYTYYANLELFLFKNLQIPEQFNCRILFFFKLKKFEIGSR
ncbi:hypothetical protein RFI_26948 [Reticulomyxa filosa]|uniref:Uncharacterized protein n=1 Tax=Reticulomyxa filosa TaxID=46433 RepID=X6M8W6_RETFI|nr:hypothetical protein RFI_26948 [Reticulomyxa filosa]|eukprot:ETO10428.1 hypothetical protein RFI_26948 [Reticulomyxa filosa]